MTFPQICFTAFVLNTLVLAATTKATEIVVKAGKFDRVDTVISVPIDRIETGANYLVRDVNSGAATDCQWGDEELLFLLPEPIKVGTSRTYQLEPLKRSPKQSEAKFSANDDAIQFTLADKLVAQYHMAVQEPPEGVEKYYRRSGFIHPVKTPNGKVLTAPFPADHLHQHALFAAWTKCEFQGHPVDFWNQKKQLGTVKHRFFKGGESWSVYAKAEILLSYVDLSQPDKPVDVLAEEWHVRLFAHPQRHLFEIISTQKCVTDSPLTVKEYHYGGMAFRGSEQWRDKNVKFLTSEGKSREDGNHTRPNWVSLYGEVDGETCGISIFSHPGNFRSPQPVRLHPSMPYFVFSPPVLGDFEIAPDDLPLRNRYLYYAFDGEPNVKEINRLWNDYASPPKVIVK